MQTLKLTEPVTFAGETITELKLRRPKAKDLRSLPAEPKPGDLLDIAARLSGHTHHVIDELCVEDAVRLLEIVGNSFGSGLKIGEN